MENLSGYDNIPDFGAWYDAVPAYAKRADVAFYLAEATGAAPDAPAAVLELGCGTGRILLPLARAGHPVTGIDSSAAMLARCSAKLASEPREVRERVVLHSGDVRDFAVGPGFALAIAPFRVLQHLTSVDDQLGCLAHVRRHLAPRGRFVFDVFNPRFSLMAQDRTAEVEDTPELALSDGRYLRRTTRVTRVRWVEQLSEVEIIYYVRAGTTVERVVQAFPMRWYGAAELEHLLVRAGFQLRAMCGDFDRSALRDESPEIVVIATRSD